tara:strand:- start:32 stop:826 length:795 start_codon:yes stop_codon:yes gene_type:complete
MKKYLVIGNPIEHSLSPKLHNYWIKKNNIKAIYEKKMIVEKDIKNIILKIKDGDIHGINVTVPFKKSVIPFLNKLSPEAQETQSVNTIYKEGEEIIGHNTDIAGFELSLRHSKYDVKDKKVLILGAGGVVPSIIFSIKKMGASKIILCNRTVERAEQLKKYFPEVEIIKWGEEVDFEMIINATSVGLKSDDEIQFNYLNKVKNKFFFDVIYNPNQTNFLKKANKNGNRTENGKMMFIYQAHQAFTIWHKVMPEINDETVALVEK